MIPSGYKEDVVYSQIPTSSAGDLSFTRASNGTRINSAGLVEDCPWNIAQYSEDFTNAFWTPTNATKTGNTETAPNGTLTADTISATANLGQIQGAITGTIGTTYTVSFYIKRKTGTGTVNIRAVENVNTAITVTNNWTRVSFTATATSTTIRIGISLATSGDEVYLWGGQLVEGSVEKPYFPTTDRLNVPRLTYQNGGGGCPSLLLEPQRTNLLIWSENFSNAAWVDSFGSITLNVATSPDGTTNAASYKDNNTGGTGEVRIYNEINVDAASTYTFSIFIKSSGLSQWALLQATDFDGALDGFAYFDIVNGVVGVSTNLSSTKIENYGNGWYRCSITWTQGATDTLVRSQFQIVAGNNNKNVTRNGTNGYYVWGAQTEKGAYPTSYIPTTSASATRVADACFKTGISSLIGQSEGVIFADIPPQTFNNSAFQTIAIIYPNAGLGGTYFHFYKKTGTTNLFFELYNATVQCSMSYTMANNTRYKVAAGYKNNDFVLYVNGVQVGSDNTGTVASVTYSTLEMGYDSFNTNSQMSLSEFVLFKTRLTNAELASLTTI
jgi:hypothetical protein